MSRRPVRVPSALRAAVGAARPRPVYERIRHAVPVIGQCGAAAGAAWWITESVFGHRQPIFAAAGAVVCLAAGIGGRARQAVDLFAGVLAGVAAGEVIQLFAPGPGAWQAAVGVGLAMIVAAVIDARPLSFIQAGAAVLIVLALPGREPALARLLDAAVGGALGLFGSQVLFSPDPVRLVAAPVRGILQTAAEAARTAADAVGRSSLELAATASDRAREALARLGELAHTRLAAKRVTMRTVRGRHRAARLRQIDDRLDDVDILVAATLLLCDDIQARLAGRPAPAPPGRLQGQLTDLAAALDELAGRHLPPVEEAPAGRQRDRGGRPGGPVPHAESAESTADAAAAHLRAAAAALDRLRATTVPGD